MTYTIDQLEALPFVITDTDSFAPHPSGASVASGLAPSALNGLPFTGGSNFSQGQVSSDYYRQYKLHGKPFRWWKAFNVSQNSLTALGPNGETIGKDALLFIEQTSVIDTTYDNPVTIPMTDVRMIPYGTREDMVDTEFGLIPKGSTGISVLATQVIFSRYDQILLDGNIKMTAENLSRAATGDDVLTQSNITQIDEIIKVAAGVNGIIVPTTEYSLVDGALHWLSSNTVNIGDLYSISYRFQPLYQWLPQSNQGVMIYGADNKPLPQRGVLWEVK